MGMRLRHNRSAGKTPHIKASRIREWHTAYRWSIVRDFQPDEAHQVAFEAARLPPPVGPGMTNDIQGADPSIPACAPRHFAVPHDTAHARWLRDA